MSSSIPENMQAIRPGQENGKLQVRELSVSTPGPGEVLVRIAASTINPSKSSKKADMPLLSTQLRPASLEACLSVWRTIRVSRFSILFVDKSRRICCALSERSMYLLVSAEADFDQNLKELAQRLNSTHFLDAISGEFTQRLIDTSPIGSLIFLYSNLSQSPAMINPNSLWYFDRRVEGFILSTWAPKQSLLKILCFTRRVQKLAHTDLTTTFHERIPFTSVQGGLERYQKNMTAGKILLVIDQDEISLNT